MSGDELWEALHRRGVELWIEEDRLRYRATREPLTPNLLAAMREEREPLLARLRAPASDAFPLSAGQQGIWFLCQAAPASSAYNVAFAFRIVSPLDRDALRAALLRLLHRHPSLRTVFDRRGDEPAQRVLPEPVLAFETLDAASWTEAEVSAAVHAESQRPFDLERGPLLRALLVATARDHVLLLTLHHLVHDGWSLWLLLDELRELYAASREARLPALPAAGATYRDFVAAEARTLAGAAAARARTAWRERLAGPLPLLDLPADRPRPPVRSDRGGSAPFLLDPALTAGLRALASAEGVTLYGLLLAAFQVFLHRLSGQEDLVVGSPVSGRDDAAFTNLVGYCINQVALRADLRGDPPFRAALSQARQRILEALEHQADPFTRLVEDLRPARDPGRTPLFQATFALQRPHRFAEAADLFAATEMGIEVEPGRRIAWGTLTLAPYVLAHRRAWFDLTLQMLEVRDVLAGSLTYSADLYDEPTARRLAGHFRALLWAIVADPGQPVSRLALVSPADAAPLAGDDAGAALRDPGPRTLSEGFRAQAARRPDAVALSGEDGVLTYGALEARANRLARHLRRRGVGPETIVGVAGGRSTRLLVGILGVLKAGGAYLPLDPEYPDERLHFMLADAGAALVLAEPGLAARLAPAGLPVVDLDPAAPALQAESLAALAPLGEPDTLAYVIYTSGSTGRPKGVLVTQANVGRLFGAAGPWLDPGETDVWSMAHSAAFDFSVWEMWGAWLHGGRLMVASRETARSPEEMLRLLTDEGVTVLSQTPGAFHALAAVALRDGGWTPGPLRLVVFGGDALEPARLRPWIERHGDSAPLLVNMYGITETTVHVTERPLGRADLDRPGSSRIGRPLRDLHAPLLDRHLAPVPAGLPGELCVGGAGVARGYLGRPGLTAERFRPDPSGRRPGARLYRSGDLARRRDGGDLEYLGRLDQQVKIRGFRIEPGEVEAALMAHPGVSAACVVARRDGEGPARLQAHVVPDAARAGPVLRALVLQREGRLPGRGLLELPGGLAVIHLNPAETAFVHGEIFERGAYLRHGVEVRDGDVVLDVGASIGLFPLALHRRGLRVRVLAFEPLPEALACLRANADLHGLDLDVVPCALGAEEGPTAFTYYPEASVLSGRFANPADEARLVRSSLFRGAAGETDGAGVADLLAERLQARALTVPMRRLSAILAERGIERVGLLKIDAEKGELDVLRGLDPADFARIDQLVVEVHDVAGRRAAVEALLRGHGYRVTVDQDEALAGTEVVSVYATRRPPTGSDGPRSPGIAPWASAASLLEDLRRHLRARLPEHMVPSVLVLLPALPLTANGKVDRRALPAPESPGAEGPAGVVTPRTPTERTLAEVWARVLRLPRVGVTDNFFELGGDSILSIAVATRAQDAGLRLVSRQLFQHQTIADLAAALDGAVDPGSAAALAGPPRLDTAPGPVLLGPAQRWFLGLGLAEPHHFNQAVRLELAPGVSAGAVRRALRDLCAEHQALRLYLEREGDGAGESGGLVPRLAAPGVELPLAVVDLAGLDGAGEGAGRATELARLADQLQAGLDLETPPLLRGALVRLAGGGASLLLVAHHLVVDAVSWRIVADHLRAALEAPAPGSAPRRAVRATPFYAWVEGLAGLVRSGAWDADLDHWLALARPPPRPLPVDIATADPGARTHGAAATLATSLDPAETRALLQELPAARRAHVNEPLLVALLQACRRWTGEDRLLIDLEGHGRDEVVEGADLSRTVGWFTAIFPVLLSAEGATGPAELLRAVGARLRQVPRRGLSHGVLLHLRGDPAIAARLRALPPAEIGFNYLGRLDDGLASLAQEALGRPFGPRNRRPHLLDVDAFVAGERLHVRWTYGSRLYRRETIERLAEDYLEALRDLALLARPGGPGPRVAAGPAGAGLDPAGLRRLARALDRKDPR